MSFPNSSGSVERTWLAPGQFKQFQVSAPGGTGWEVDVHGDNPNNDPLVTPVTATSATVLVQTSEDGTAWTTLTTLTVVPGGYKGAYVLAGKYTQFINSGTTGSAIVVAKPINRVQPVSAL